MMSIGGMQDARDFEKVHQYLRLGCHENARLAFRRWSDMNISPITSSPLLEGCGWVPQEHFMSVHIASGGTAGCMCVTSASRKSCGCSAVQHFSLDKKPHCNIPSAATVSETTHSLA